MFKRLVLEDWHLSMPAIAFFLAFTVFVILVIRTLRMKQEKVDHLAKLPLEKDPRPSSNRKNRNG